jgi:small GTP-binding protein
MALLNLKTKEIQLKIVYYGPGRGGKTTCIEYLHAKLAARKKAEMIKIKGNQERTLFFDFYPMNIGQIKGFQVRVQLYSVPGQDRLEPLRKLIVRGVDGIVFVADSMIMRRQHNIHSFQNLSQTLTLYNKKISSIPLVIQFNKSDLPLEGVPILSPESIKADLETCLDGNRHIIQKTPCYSSSTVSGKNILEPLQTVISMILKNINFNSLFTAP